MGRPRTMRARPLKRKLELARSYAVFEDWSSARNLSSRSGNCPYSSPTMPSICEKVEQLLEEIKEHLSRNSKELHSQSEFLAH